MASCLFVGDLSVCCRESHLKELFTPYGKVLKTEIKQGQKPFKFLGYGFITLPTIEEAENAKNCLNGCLLLGRKLRINWSSNTGNLKEAPCAEIAFSFISKQVNYLVYEQTIRDLFNSYGADVVDVAIKQYKIEEMKPQQSGIGFVHFPLSAEGVLAAKKSVDHLANVVIKEILFDCDMSTNLRNILAKQPELNTPYQSTRPAVCQTTGMFGYSSQSPRMKVNSQCIDIGFDLPYLPLACFDHMQRHNTMLLKSFGGGGSVGSSHSSSPSGMHHQNNSNHFGGGSYGQQGNGSYDAFDQSPRGNNSNGMYGPYGQPSPSSRDYRSPASTGNNMQQQNQQRQMYAEGNGMQLHAQLSPSAQQQQQQYRDMRQQHQDFESSEYYDQQIQNGQLTAAQIQKKMQLDRAALINRQHGQDFSPHANNNAQQWQPGMFSQNNRNFNAYDEEMMNGGGVGDYGGYPVHHQHPPHYTPTLSTKHAARVYRQNSGDSANNGVHDGYRAPVPQPNYGGFSPHQHQFPLSKHAARVYHEGTQHMKQHPSPQQQHQAAPQQPQTTTGANGAFVHDNHFKVVDPLQQIQQKQLQQQQQQQQQQLSIAHPSRMVPPQPNVPPQQQQQQQHRDMVIPAPPDNVYFSNSPSLATFRKGQAQQQQQGNLLKTAQQNRFENELFESLSPSQQQQQQLLSPQNRIEVQRQQHFGNDGNASVYDVALQQQQQQQLLDYSFNSGGSNHSYAAYNEPQHVHDNDEEDSGIVDYAQLHLSDSVHGGRSDFSFTRASAGPLLDFDTSFMLQLDNELPPVPTLYLESNTSTEANNTQHETKTSSKDTGDGDDDSQFIVERQESNHNGSVTAVEELFTKVSLMDTFQVPNLNGGGGSHRHAARLSFTSQTSLGLDDRTSFGSLGSSTHSTHSTQYGSSSLPSSLPPSEPLSPNDWSIFSGGQIASFLSGIVDTAAQ